MRKLAICFVLACVAAPLALVGAVPARAADTIKFATSWNAPNILFIHIYSAIKQGYYKAANIDVDMQMLSGSVPAVVAVANGNADIGQAGPDAILTSIGSGSKLVSIFLFYQQTPTGVIVTKESGVKTIAGLKGMTVSTSLQSPEGIMLNALLREAKINPETEVKILNVAPAAKITMLINGETQAATGFVNFQFLQAQAAGKQVNFIPFSTPQRPIYGHAIFAKDEWLASHRDLAKRFIAATVKGLVWAHDHPDEAATMTANWDPTLKMDVGFFKKDWQTELDQLVFSADTKKNGVGHMQTAGWQNLYDMLASGGVIKNKIDVSKVYTNDFIPADAPRW